MSTEGFQKRKKKADRGLCQVECNSLKNLQYKVLYDYIE